MSKTVVLNPGDFIEIGGQNVTVTKCGLHRQGGGDAKPTVTLEISDPSVVESVADIDSPGLENETPDTSEPSQE